jgi:hypothetical protein
MKVSKYTIGSLMEKDCYYRISDVKTENGSESDL